MITQPGYYDMSLSEYLADPCPEPSLSTGVVMDLFRRTPAHARMNHPRLGGKKSSSSTRGDIGTAIHTMVTGNGPRLVYLDQVTKRSGADKGMTFVPTDWKTKDAQEQQELIRSRGEVPLLVSQREQIEKASESARIRLSHYPNGEAEKTLCFEHEGVWLRGRSDWLIHNTKSLEGYEVQTTCKDIDIKTCDNCDPVDYQRIVYANGLDVQMAIRYIGHKKLTGESFKMSWLLVEYEEPYSSLILHLSQEVIDLAIKKVNHACKLWRECLKHNTWLPAHSEATMLPTAYADWELVNRGVE